MRSFLAFAAVLLAGSLLAHAAADETLGPLKNPLWLRYPAISPDGKIVAFSFRGHLFTAPAEGGRAEALTAGPGFDTSPVWSPDGKLIAFASDRYGHLDVFVVSAQGGTARRLTFYSTDQTPTGFTPDSGFVLFSAHRMDSAKSAKFPLGRVLPEFYKVAVEGGKQPELLLSTPALGGQLDRAGTRLLYEDLKGYEDLWRKHEVSSIAHDVWIWDLKTGEHTKLTDFVGEDRNPRWAPDEQSVYYLSEQSGNSNVWQLSLGQNGAGKPVQITHYERNPARFLTVAQNGTLCFGYDGEIYLQNPGETSPRKLSVEIAMTDSEPNQQLVQYGDSATDLAVSPNGKEIAFIVRGDVYVASVEGGETKRITNTPQQERNVSFSPDGRHLVFAAEYDRPWGIYEASIAQPKEKEPYFFNSTQIDIHPVVENGSENFQPLYSPDGKEIAYLENRTALKVVDLASKQARLILPGDRNYSYSDGDQFFDWSPDGKWFLVTFKNPERYSPEVGLVDSSGRQELTDLTHSGFDSFEPLWTNDGKSMIWASDAQGLHGFGYAEDQPVDVYEMFFTAAAYQRFKLPAAEFEVVKELEEETKKKENPEKGKEGATGSPSASPTPASSPGASAGPSSSPATSPTPAVTPSPSPTPPEVVLDLKNTDDRVARLTLSSDVLQDMKLSNDGETLLYLAKGEKGIDLWSLKIREKELKRLTQFETPPPSPRGVQLPNKIGLTKDGKAAFVLAGGRIAKVGIGDGKIEPVRFNAAKEIDGRAERAYLFEHMWRLIKEKFYRADMRGVDWDYYKGVYAKFLPYISESRSFAEMMSEMLGELNASHTGCRYYPAPADETASLGAFFDPTYEGAGLKILELIEKGPLASATTVPEPGDIIEKIDGIPILPQQDVSPLLNHKAGQRVLLTILHPPRNEHADLTVKPINAGELNELLYERWVKQRRELVHQLSHEAVGYVHVRGMDDGSYRNVFSEALGREVTKKALVVDTRFNGGGNLHDQLATFLSGEQYLKQIPRGQFLGWWPSEKWNHPSAVLMSESNYSDAHLFPWVYQYLKIGKLIGMPVPGTGTAVWWEVQMDPQLLFGIPEGGIVDKEGQYMETTPVTPDLQVFNDPKSLGEGRDLQVEAGVKELLNTK